MVVGSNGASICLSVLWGARPASELPLIPEFCDSEILTMASYYIFYFYPHVVNLQIGSLYYQSSLFIYFKIYLFIWLGQVLLVACGTLAPQPGIERRSTCIGVWNLRHWTTREVPVGSLERSRFDSWVGKVHCRKDRLPTAVFLEYKFIAS